MNPPAMVIPFVKASACGNDFLIIDGSQTPDDLAALSKRLCDRHQGVGADGVEWLFPASDADVCARLFNADGSEAEISGNGTRCVAAYLCVEQAKEKVVVRTGAGLKICTLTSRSETQYEFEIAMGEPQVGTELPVRLASREVRGIPVSMGNPHYVVFVKEFASGWQAEAAEMGQHGDFKQGINVELVRIEDGGNIAARFYERGVGETQSSGTGSCAAAVAAIATQKAKSPVRVHAPGGTQTVRWHGEVFLRGPAQLICRGEFLL
ncbi:Diaminopimelate epimerase [Candidatus Sulfotelmatobacter sp. SbA7]|jgi:diaminopimelate epimerase|nr:Diaminopimelate epimerase [Candidatus Sulfotelmatobacter sp. SbA7]